ncbi:MAG: DeoR/GlpR transcriptional regulator [Clostridia bacterium]|nr:DeoR/GlpR transcriptional regulator [Clostridia bacterium]
MIRAEERQSYILNTAKENGFASITDIAKRLNVSIETIRRDINELCKENLVKKVRGGAVLGKPACRKDDDFMLRIKSNQHQKLTIGARAASMIQDGFVVALDAGASVQSIASCIKNVKNVTFIVNSISTAGILLDKFKKDEVSGRIIFVGGELDTQNRFSKGAMASSAVGNYYFDIAFVSCTAVSCEAVSSYNLDECSYSRQLIERASMSVLVAESNKIDKNSICSFAKIADFATIITDDKNQISDLFKKQYEDSKTELVIVSV